MTLTYSLVSDLHLDHPQPKITPDSLEKLIIVAGDTGNGLVGLKYLNKLKRRGHTVFAIDGNHEHYANESQQRLLVQTERAFYSDLEQDQILDLPSYRIIGCNGWYLVPDANHWRGHMNDYLVGPSGSVNEAAIRQTYWLEQQLERLPLGIRAIVVTHTAPCEETLDPRFARSLGNQYYYNPIMTRLMAKFADRIAVWHHGHTHHRQTKTVNNVSVITNPRGYPGENPDWKPLRVTIE